MVAMARLNWIWWCNTISSESKFKLCKSLVISILHYGCETWTLLTDSEKRIQAFETKFMRKLRYLLLGAHDQQLGAEKNQFPCGSKKTCSSNFHKDANLHGLGMSHAKTASQKTSFRAPWRVGNAVVSRGNAGWTTSKTGHICPCQNCSQRPHLVKTGRGSLLHRSSCPPDDPIGQGTELNSEKDTGQQKEIKK